MYISVFMAMRTVIGLAWGNPGGRSNAKLIKGWEEKRSKFTSRHSNDPTLGALARPENGFYGIGVIIDRENMEELCRESSDVKIKY